MGGLTGFVGYPRNVRKGAVGPEKFGVKSRKYVLDLFDSIVVATTSAGTAFPSGTTGAKNQVQTASAVHEYHILGAGQTIVAPSQDANGRGLDWALDQASTEGVQVILGGYEAVGTVLTRPRTAFTVADGRPFFARLKVNLEDASGADFWFGLRKAQAYQTAWASYTDYAALFADGTATVGNDIKIVAKLNGGAETALDTGLDFADTVAREFRVDVDQSGRCRFLVDGNPPSVNLTSFVFDAGDVVLPTFMHLHTADLAGYVATMEFEAGYSAIPGV